MENIIQVKHLKKWYTSYERGHGLKESVKSLFKRKIKISEALKAITFSIQPGELVGFVGPNGAGKSTAIKILTGVLYPNFGEVSVMGYVPWKQRRSYVKHIGAVFGQKSQLWWDLPPIDSFYLTKSIYSIPDQEYQERLTKMVALLRVEDIIKRPTRDLSLGERMKCEFIMALLHNPKILFLDEPTIGVDALAKEDIRNFLVEINAKYHTTIILTSHDMDDIEEVCNRLIIIDAGNIIYDGTVEKCKSKYVVWKTIELDYLIIKNKTLFTKLLKKGIVQDASKTHLSFRVHKEQVSVPDMVADLMKASDVVDLIVHEPRLEHVIKEIYKEKEVKK